MSATQQSPAISADTRSSAASPAPRLRPIPAASRPFTAGAASSSQTRRPWAAAVAWHFFSLDAPTVAVVWCWFWGAVFHVAYSRVTLPILGMGTWIVYVTDRLLDGYTASETAALRERHWFYCRHRRFFTTVCLAVAAPLTWMILRMAQPGVRAGDIALCILGIAYFSLVHGRQAQAPTGTRSDSLVPKELAVGFLFAAACTMPALLRARHVPAMLAFDAIAFGALCSLNCVAIQTWEDEEAAQEVVHSILAADQRALRIHPVTAFLGRHLRVWSVALLLLAVGGVYRAASLSLALPWVAIGGSAALFLLLLHWRARLSALAVRIAADAALLTPLLLWPLLR
jgi:hypothetical protein